MLKKADICFLINMLISVLILYFVINYFITDTLLCDNVINITNEFDVISDINVISEDNCCSINEIIIENSPGWYIKYKLIIKRKLYWYFKIGNSRNYSYYNEFKPNWDPNQSIWKELGAQLKSAIKDPKKDFNETRDLVERNILRKKYFMEKYAQARANYQRRMMARKLDIINNYLRRNP